MCMGVDGNRGCFDRCEKGEVRWKDIILLRMVRLHGIPKVWNAAIGASLARTSRNQPWPRIWSTVLLEENIARFLFEDPSPPLP